MHWNDRSKQHQIKHSIETTLCDQFQFLCHLILSFVISLTTHLELWRRYNSPILCCGVQSPIAHWHHIGAGFPVINSGLPKVRNIVFVSDKHTLVLDKHTLVFQPSLTLFVLPAPCDRVYNLNIIPLSSWKRIKLYPSIWNSPTFLTKFLLQVCFPLHFDCLPSGTSIFCCDNLGLSGTHILCCWLSSWR
jgi:hypothetical protein